MGYEAGVAAGNVALVIYAATCIPRAFMIAIARPGLDRIGALEIGALGLFCAVLTTMALAGFYASARLFAPFLWENWLALTLMRLIEFSTLVTVAIAWWRMRGLTRRKLIRAGCVEAALALATFLVVLWVLW